MCTIKRPPLERSNLREAMGVVEERKSSKSHRKGQEERTSESVSLCSNGMSASGGMPDPSGQCQQEDAADGEEEEEEEEIEKHK